LKQTRLALLGFLPDPHHDTQKIDNALKAYFSVLRGFFEQPDNTVKPGSDEEGAASGLTRQGKKITEIKSIRSQKVRQTLPSNELILTQLNTLVFSEVFMQAHLNLLYLTQI
jgi:hypothetical protein